MGSSNPWPTPNLIALQQPCRYHSPNFPTMFENNHNRTIPCQNGNSDGTVGITKAYRYNLLIIQLLRSSQSICSYGKTKIQYWYLYRVRLRFLPVIFTPLCPRPFFLSLFILPILSCYGLPSKYCGTLAS